MTDETRIEQGIRLQQLFDALNLTQKAAAQRLGISQGFITKIINGKKNVSARVLNELTIGFEGFSPVWLMSGEGEMFLPNSSELQTPDEEYRRQPATDRGGIDVIALVNALTGAMDMVGRLDQRVIWLEREVSRLSIQIGDLLAEKDKT